MSQLLALVKMFNDEHSFYIDDLPEAAAKTDKDLLNFVATKVYSIESEDGVGAADTALKYLKKCKDIREWQD